MINEPYFKQASAAEQMWAEFQRQERARLEAVGYQVTIDALGAWVLHDSRTD